MEELRQALEEEARVAYALLFGSRARGSAHAASDFDVAVGLVPGAELDPHELGALVSSLEQAAGRTIDLVLLDEAPPAVAYRVFRDGQVILERDHSALVECKARAIMEYLDFQPLEEIAVRGVVAAGPPMVDKTVLAAKLAAVRDAVERIADVLPATSEEFRSDRTTREIVTLNLFFALQDCLALATHWLADAGWDVPRSYGEVFAVLGERGILDQELAARLRAAAGLRSDRPPVRPPRLRSPLRSCDRAAWRLARVLRTAGAACCRRGSAGGIAARQVSLLTTSQRPAKN